MVYLRRILVTTDLSEYSLAAMEYASSLGLLYASKLYLLYVVDKKEGHQQRSEETAAEALERFVQKNINPELKLIPIVRFGAAADEIRKFADEAGVDLVVMATHGRTGVKHILMGSVAEKVVRISGTPVLTVKPRPILESLLEEADVEQELHLR